MAPGEAANSEITGFSGALVLACCTAGGGAAGKVSYLQVRARVGVGCIPLIRYFVAREHARLASAHGLTAICRWRAEARHSTLKRALRRPVPEQTLLLDHCGGLRRHQLFPAWVAGLDACQHCARRDVQLAGVELAYGCDVNVLDEMRSE